MDLRSKSPRNELQMLNLQVELDQFAKDWFGSIRKLNLKVELDQFAKDWFGSIRLNQDVEPPS